MLVANVTYVFSERDGGFAAFGSLVTQLFLTFTTPAPTTIGTTTLDTTLYPTTTSNNSTNIAWIVAIIVPVAIVLGLIPCWILLCVSFMMTECKKMCIGSEVIHNMDLFSFDPPFK